MKFIALEKSGRRSSGVNGDHGKIAHALQIKDGRRDMDVEGSTERALCGAKPSRSSSWSSYQSTAVTCPQCLKKLALATS